MEQKKLTERAADVTRRFYELNERARKKDISSLEDNANLKNIEYRDIFEYGLSLCVNGIESARLDMILSNLIKQEKDPREKLFKSIQKEAVLHIQKGSRSGLFLCSLFSYLSIDEIKEMRSCVSNPYILEEINLLLEKPYNKYEILNESFDFSSETFTKPFSFFYSVDQNILLEHLKKEQPKVIAYVISLLDPKKAAFFLSNLSVDLQSDIAYRIAVMDTPEIDLLYDALKLEKKLLSLSGKKYTNIDSNEFEKLLKVYLLRQNSIDEALELYKKASNMSAASGEAIALTNRLIHVMRGKPIDFIKTDPAAFFKLLMEEHPKTIASILSIIAPEKAALMLQLFPDYLKCDIARRIALMDNSEVVTQETREKKGLRYKAVSNMPPSEIRVMEKKISAMFNKDCVFEGGLKKFTDLLCLVDSKTSETIMDFLEAEYPELIQTISDYLFVFEDIVMLNDKAIQKVMRNVNTEDLTKALKYASDKVKKIIFNNITKRAAIMLKEEIECMTDVSMEESDAAQKKIVSVIRFLEEMGEIVAAVNNEIYV